MNPSCTLSTHDIILLENASIVGEWERSKCSVLRDKAVYPSIDLSLAQRLDNRVTIPSEARRLLDSGRSALAHAQMTSGRLLPGARDGGARLSHSYAHMRMRAILA